VKAVSGSAEGGHSSWEASFLVEVNLDGMTLRTSTSQKSEG
jgi:hypothetical protein